MGWLNAAKALAFRLVTEKKALTPVEFAKLFGKERSWSYRLLNQGKITAITEYGRIMIPASEAARIEGDAQRYRGKKTAKKKIVKALVQQQERDDKPDSKKRWAKAVESQRKSPKLPIGSKSGKPPALPVSKVKKGLSLPKKAPPASTD